MFLSVKITNGIWIIFALMEIYATYCILRDGDCKIFFQVMVRINNLKVNVSTALLKGRLAVDQIYQHLHTARIPQYQSISISLLLFVIIIRC